MRRYNVLVVVAVLVLFIGCAGTVKLKDPTEMTPQEKATFVMKMYSKASANVLEMEKLPLTPEQRSAVDAQKKFLREASIAIDAYNGYIDGGMKPNAELEKTINSLIDRFLLSQ